MKLPLENTYVVVCYGISDIGKGWLTAAITGLAPQRTLPVKIDPLLNLSFPQHLGVSIQDLCEAEDVQLFIHQGRAASGHFKISEDFLTYHEVGAKVYPECNIVAGDLINRFLNSPDVYIRQNEIKKRTFTDLSCFLAKEITSIARARNPYTLIIEVGGTIEDHESVYVPSAIRFLRQPEFLRVVPEVILLTFFEFAEAYDKDRYRVKTQHIRRSIIQTSKAYYDLPLKACFVRRRNVPDFVSDEMLLRDLQNAAYETQIPSEKVVLLPNVEHGSIKENLKEITDFIRESGLFEVKKL